ncbi:MAG: hypothetical protein LKF82_11875 [Acinetobacter populi]|jgi:hypothetical protein|uniref:hypothetical protein n=1 Tax=Acinetobacter populi TaxID=1582270 RepID=UPI002352DE17|nr:hypothetical protein [Acinetobacter populi]MCH4248510.1 hypothetical protein [Acinetobacter populi]
MSISSLLTITGLFDLIKNLFGLIKSFLNLFLENTYKKSHQIWLSHNRLCDHWYKHESLFEYSVYFPSITDSNYRKARIAIRSLEGKDISSLSFNIEVDSVFNRYVEPIVNLKNITRKPIYINLSKIPPQDLIHCDKNAGIIFAWDSFNIDVIDLKFSHNDEIIQDKKGITHHLSHTWLLNSSWVNCNGKCYNIDAIDECKRRIYMWWKFGFARPKVITFTQNPQPINIINKFKNILLQPIINLIIWIATQDIILSLQFWIAISSQLFILTDNEELKWRWSKNNITTELC